MTGDLFNLYVWFEVMLISSFALLALAVEQVAVGWGASSTRRSIWFPPSLFLIAIGCALWR